MATLEVLNMMLTPGMELKVSGVVKPNPERFSINVGHNMDAIALHFDARFDYGADKRTIVLNSKKEAEAWGVEQKEKAFSFEAGKEFEVAIVFQVDTFDIILSNGITVQYNNRLGDKSYEHIFFLGDAVIHSISVKTHHMC